MSMHAMIMSVYGVYPLPRIPLVLKNRHNSKAPVAVAVIVSYYWFVVPTAVLVV